MVQMYLKGGWEEGGLRLLTPGHLDVTFRESYLKMTNVPFISTNCTNMCYFEDKARNISLLPRADDKTYCPGETLRATFKSNPEPNHFIWSIWNGTAWEVLVFYFRRRQIYIRKFDT